MIKFTYVNMHLEGFLNKGKEMRAKTAVEVWNAIVSGYDSAAFTFEPFADWIC